jgi:hypothetical protein
MATVPVSNTESRTADGDGTKVSGRGKCVVTVNKTSGTATFAVNQDQAGLTKPVDNDGTALTATDDQTWVLDWPAESFHTVWVTVSSASSLASTVSIEFDGEPPLR